MKYTISIFLFICVQLTLFAQAKKEELPSIIFKGKITFERKTNTHKQLDEMMKKNGRESFMEAMKQKTPKYKIDVFDLFFTSIKSLYQAAPDGIQESKMMMSGIPAESNKVYNDYEIDNYVAEKKIFEKTYLVQDSMKKFEWKITDEYRSIAGLNCRRAETIIMDSVYVIAYYTDAIIANGGPESFGNLPGMILGIVMPRLNVTYFATKIENYLSDEKIIHAPTKGTKTTLKQLDSELKSSLVKWGDMAQRIQWYANL